MAEKESKDQNTPFLGIPKNLQTYVTAKAVVLPLPLEKTTSYMKGTARGPKAILDASTQVEFYDSELGVEPCQAGISTDFTFLDGRLDTMTMEDSIESIQKQVEKHLEHGKFVLSLGGEHTISVGTVPPYLDRFSPLTIVQIDAHADMREEYEGSPFSHACVMRRLVDRAQLVSIGIRSTEKEEQEYARRVGVTTIFGHELDPADRWIERAIQSIANKNVYLTIDVDGFDPSVVPAVGTPEPGGLLWYPAMRFLRRLFETKNVVGADVNELRPLEVSWPDFTVAKLCYKILGYKLALSKY